MFAPICLSFHRRRAPLAAQAADEPASVGIVGNVENEAKVVSGDTVTAAIIGMPVHLRHELRTGPEGRLKVTFRDDTIAVSTPVADIAVRSTEFWGGPLEKYGVLVLEGELTVSNQSGSVTLSGTGQGTDVPSPLDPPGPAKAWGAEKIARAVATVTLH
ncbi:MAG: hypothetical protein WBQ20_16545 [Methyloceanibacter sp.]